MHRPPGDLPVARLIARTAGGAVAVRPAGPADRLFLGDLDGIVVTDRLGLAGLPAEIWAPLLELQLAARRRDRAERFPSAEEVLILLDDRPVGGLTVDRGAQGTVIVDLALMPAARRRGIATALLGTVGAEADRAGIPVRATADTANVASRRLFAAAGYHETGDDGVNVSLERPAGPGAVPEPPAPGGG